MHKIINNINFNRIQSIVGSGLIERLAGVCLITSIALRYLTDLYRPVDAKRLRLFVYQSIRRQDLKGFIERWKDKVVVITDGKVKFRDEAEIREVQAFLEDVFAFFRDKPNPFSELRDTKDSRVILIGTPSREKLAEGFKELIDLSEKAIDLPCFIHPSNWSRISNITDNLFTAGIGFALARVIWEITNRLSRLD